MSSSSQQHEPRLVRFFQRVYRFVGFYIGPQLRKFKQVTPRISEHAHTLKATAKQKLLSGIKGTAYWSGICVVGLVIAGVIMEASGVPIFSSAHAQGVDGIGNWIAVLMMNFLYLIVLAPLAALALIFGYIFQVVVTYPYGTIWSVTGTDTAANGFINVSGVITGWTLVRDVCNVFFALILVIIALGTVLRLEGYQYKQMLPTFVSAVILINFSRTICGVFTDFATIAMATFAGSFGDSFITGILSGFGLPTAFDFVTGGNTDDFNQSSFVSIILAYVALTGILIFLLPLLIVFTALLIFRIIMLWFLIAISPIAFFCRILPQTKKYANEWWQRFGSTVTVGPILTFFLWLALTMAYGTQPAEGDPSGTTNLGNKFAAEIQTSAIDKSGATGAIKPPSSGPFQASSPNVLANFMIMYLMLLAGLRITMQVAGELGSMASKLGGVGEMALYKSGQILGRGGLALNKTVGQRKGFLGGASRFVGTSAAMLGSTALQPREFWGRFKQNWSRSSQIKQDMFATDMTHQSEALLSNQVLMQGNGIRAVNLAKKTAGVLWGGGLKNGQGVFDQYVSWNNAKNVGRYFANRKLLTPTEKKKLEDAAKNAEKRYEKTGRQVTAEEYDDMLEAHQEVSEKFGRTKDLRFGIQDGKAALNLHDPATKSLLNEKVLPVLENELNRLEALGGPANIKRADQLRAKINDVKYLANPEQRTAKMDEYKKRIKEIDNIKDKKKRNASQAERLQLDNKLKALERLQNPTAIVGDTITAGDLFNNFMGGGALADKAKKGITDVLDVKVAQMDQGLRESMVRLAQAGVQFNGGGTVLGVHEGENYDIKSKPQNPTFTTADARSEAEREFRNAENELKQLQILEASFKPQTGVQARLEKQARINKAFSEMRDVKSSDELVGYAGKAVNERNGDTLTGAAMALAAGGDLRLLLSDARRVNKNGEINEKARSDAVGLFDFIDNVMQKEMGMTKQEALERMNDVVSLAARNGNMNLSGSIVYEGNEWKAVEDEGLRNKLRIEAMKASNITDAVKWGANDWGHTDANGRYKLDVEVAAQVLLHNGEDLASDRWWNSVNPNAKSILAKEVDQLRARGVSPQLIQRLEEYWQTTGRFEGPSGVTQRNFYS